MASLVARKNKAGKTTSWQVKWREEGAQKSQTFDDEPTAVTFKRILEQNKHNGNSAERQILSAFSSAPKFSEVAEEHMDRLRKLSKQGAVGVHSVHTYERMLTLKILPALGDIPIDMVSEEDLESWVGTMLDDSLSPKTIKNYHGLISSIFKTSITKKYRGDNPCDHTRLPKNQAVQDGTTFLTQSEFSRILKHIDPHFQPFFLFLVGTGLRFSEATALLPSDFSDENGVYTVRVTKAWKRDEKNGRKIGPPKTERARRTVPLDAVLARAVAPQVQKAGVNDTVFKMKLGGQMTVQAVWNKAWRPAVQAAQEVEGLKKSPRLHDLRHTYASWMLMGEPPISMFELSRLMGHESVNTTTKVYSHLMPETLRRGAEIMGAALGNVLGVSAGAAVAEVEAS